MSSENRALWIGAVAVTVVFAVAGVLAGPGTLSSWALIVASGPVAAAVIAVAWRIQGLRARRSSGG